MNDTSTNYKAMYKNELAAAAGVSMATFRRWLRTDREQLASLGCDLNAQLLNPAAVRYLCCKYVITL